MPKIGPNGVSIDPKAAAKRITNAKKIIAKADPAVKAKIKGMYPAVTKKAIVDKALSPKKATAKPQISKAEKAMAKELSPKGVKAAEKMQKGAIDKKYPGMFKK
jgi:hypothetical protein